MTWWLQSGHAADLILAVIALEATWLKTRGWNARRIVALLGPAVMLVLGLRAALVGAQWYWIALPLALFVIVVKPL